MPKLYFRHGAVSSAKTLNLLAVAHNYRQQGKKVLILKPSIDDRFGSAEVKSRAGLQQKADVLIHPHTNLFDIPSEDRKVHCLLVDEAQFLDPKHIDQLRQVTNLWNVPVICYGLRTDFRTNLFPGSKRLLELADAIEEVKTTCHFCNKKAVFNLKHVNGRADNSGPAVQLGAEELYFPACYVCYRDSFLEAGQSTFGPLGGLPTPPSVSCAGGGGEDEAPPTDELEVNVKESPSPALVDDTTGHGSGAL